MTETRSATTPILGRLRAEHGKGVVHMEDDYATDIDDLWSALTDPDRLARWVVEADGDLSVGGEFTALFTSGWEGPGRVDVCDAPHRLSVTMSPGSADETVIEARLTPNGERTHLVIEERGLPLAEVAAHGAGWQAHIEDLAAHLAGRPAAVWHDRWVELSSAYERLADALR